MDDNAYPDNEPVTIECSKLHETDKAWLIDDGDQQVWVPKSQCRMRQTGPTYELTLPEWLAKEKGLI